jgi:hypothetical protein
METKCELRERSRGCVCHIDHRQIRLLGTTAVVMAISLLNSSASAAPPSNDNFADAQEIGGEAGSVDGTNAGATTETGEPASECGNTVWYLRTAPRAGGFVFSVTPANGFYLFSIYTGDVGKLTLIGGIFGSPVAVKANAADVYLKFPPLFS